jgi:antitoxin ParD1/3/4
MATNVDLTVELERFAHECVEGGRYDNVSEVVRSGLRLLREAEGRRQHFRLMLEAATEEADRDGPFSLDAVSAEIDEIIGAAER